MTVNQTASDQRSEPRAPEMTDVTVVIVSAPAAPELEGMVFPSSSVDISMHGLLLIVDNPVPVGAQLELRVMFSHLTMDFWHTGTVIWSQEWALDGDDGRPLHRIGIEFETHDNPQYHTWRTTVGTLLDKHGQV